MSPVNSRGQESGRTLDQEKPQKTNLKVKDAQILPCPRCAHLVDGTAGPSAGSHTSSWDQTGKVSSGSQNVCDRDIRFWCQKSSDWKQHCLHGFFSGLEWGKGHPWRRRPRARPHSEPLYASQGVIRQGACAVTDSWAWWHKNRHLSTRGAEAKWLEVQDHPQPRGKLGGKNKILKVADHVQERPLVT